MNRKQPTRHGGEMFSLIIHILSTIPPIRMGDSGRIRTAVFWGWGVAGSSFLNHGLPCTFVYLFCYTVSPMDWLSGNLPDGGWIPGGKSAGDKLPAEPRLPVTSGVGGSNGGQRQNRADTAFV